MSWVPGRMAVDDFFVLSGFVITRTLLRNYRGGAIWRCVGNRLLRRGPPTSWILVAAAVVAFVTVNWLHVPLADVHPYFFGLLKGWSDAALRSSLTLAEMRPHVGVLAGGVPLLTFTPVLIPQACSIGVEMTFYAVAPVVAAVIARWGQRGALVLLAASVVPWALAQRSGASTWTPACTPTPSRACPCSCWMQR